VLPWIEGHHTVRDLIGGNYAGWRDLLYDSVEGGIDVAVLSGQATVTSTITKVTEMPPGPANIIIVNSDSSTKIAVGHTTNLTATNGALLPPGVAISVPFYPTQANSTLYAITASGSAVISFYISHPG
jgi:hypothetical protein